MKSFLEPTPEEWTPDHITKSSQETMSKSDEEEWKAVFKQLLGTDIPPSERGENRQNAHDDGNRYYDEVIIDESRLVKEGLACRGHIRPAVFTPSQNKRFTWKNRRRDDRDGYRHPIRPTIGQGLQSACRIAAWRIQNAASSISPHSGKNYVKRPIFITEKDEPTE